MSNDWQYKLFKVPVKGDKGSLLVAATDFTSVRPAVEGQKFEIDEATDPKHWWQGQYDTNAYTADIVVDPEGQHFVSSAAKESLKLTKLERMGNLHIATVACPAMSTAKKKSSAKAVKKPAKKAAKKATKKRAKAAEGKRIKARASAR